MGALLRATLFLLPLLLVATAVEPFPFGNPLINFFFPTPPQPADNDGQPDPQQAQAGGGEKGSWEIEIENAGVSGMHFQLMPSNKVVMFDATVSGPSQIKLPEGTPCRPVPKEPREQGPDQVDCWAHAVEYDLAAKEVRPLKVWTDAWCSSGALSPDGTLVNTGGFADGGAAVRNLGTCPGCDWQEFPTALSGERWYSTQQILPDGRFILLGGRRQFGYEFIPAPGVSNRDAYDLPFLRETTDQSENNLYPFVHLSPDGNLFLFANNRAILLNPDTGKVVREFPPLPDGSRNYPASGMSALLPLDLRRGAGPTKPVAAEVVVCGGAPSGAFQLADKQQIFKEATKSCGRITITDPAAAEWAMEQMPTARTMGDMLLLPNTQVLLINGASKGCSGWLFARDPVLAPVLYRPDDWPGRRFEKLAPTTIPRMYHSSSGVLPDGSVLVAGSNTNPKYSFGDGVEFPTELRVERFSPPYLAPALAAKRPVLTDDGFASGTVVGYGETFALEFTVEDEGSVKEEEVKVTMYAPPFTTHGFSQNQRLLILNVAEFRNSDGDGKFGVTVEAPATGVLAPPGYYMVHVVNGDVPSKAVWLWLQA